MTDDTDGNAAEICAAPRADGSACRARRLPDSPYCFAHEPSLKATVAAGRNTGGFNKSNAVRAEKVLPRILRPVLPLLVQGIIDVRDGKMEPAQLSSMASGSNALVRLFSTVDTDELRARVEALEEPKVGGTDAS